MWKLLLKSGGFSESLVKRRSEDMAAINLKATSYIKVEEFVRRKKGEERWGEEGTRSKGERTTIGFRPLNNKRGGLVQTRREDRGRFLMGK